MREYNGRIWSQDEMEQIRGLREEGLGYGAIAEIMGGSKTTVARLVRQMEGVGPEMGRMAWLALPPVNGPVLPRIAKLLGAS